MKDFFTTTDIHVGWALNQVIVKGMPISVPQRSTVLSHKPVHVFSVCGIPFRLLFQSKAFYV